MLLIWYKFKNIQLALVEFLSNNCIRDRRLLDFAKTFDTINHNAFLCKLKNFGFDYRSTETFLLMICQIEPSAF